MSKLLKIVGRLTGGLLEWFLILFIIFAFAIRTSPVQTFLAQQVTKYLSKELKTKFKVDKVSIIFFNKVALDGVFVLDQKKDTLASINSVFVTLKSFNQYSRKIALDELRLQGGIVKLSREKVTGDYNYSFIVDYFDSGKKSSKSEPYQITLDNIGLERVRFHYDDNRKGYNTFGMDYDHLQFSNVYLYASRFKSYKGVLTGFVKHLSVREKCGFKLRKFSTDFNISEEGLKLKRLHIKTENSQVYFPKMFMLMNEMEDFQEFEDSVTFDAVLNESNVSLKDISYFGTTLEGMDQQVIIKAEVTNKVKNLKIAHLLLKTGNRSRLEGTVNLPDFREFNQAFFQEKLDYVYIDLKDLQRIKLPKDVGDKYISLNETVNRLGYFKAIDLKVDGFYSQFVVESDKISTALGSVRLDHGIMFSESENKKSFTFEESQASEYDVKIDSFQLGKFFNESTLGSVYGTFFMNGEIFGDGKINFNKINGEVSRIDFNGYPYKNVVVNEASYIDKIFTGNINVNDENVALNYNGFLDFNKVQRFDFDVTVNQARINKLHFIKSDTLLTLNTIFHADITGTEINNYSGYVGLQSLKYQAGKKSFDIPKMDINVDRSIENDQLRLESKMLRATVNGKIDFKTIADDFNNQFSVVFPAVFDYRIPAKSAIQNHFNYNITVQDINGLLAIFVPELKVSKGTTIYGDYNGYTNDFSMNLNSSKVSYGIFESKVLNLQQSFTDSTLSADYQLGTFSMNDTLEVKNVSFVTSGVKGDLHSSLNWNAATDNESSFIWDTKVKGISSYIFDLEPSFFSINKHRWDIENAGEIAFLPKDVHFDKFKMHREEQFISLDGALSADTSESLDIKINAFQLDDFGSLLGLKTVVKGEINGEINMSNPFENINFNGDAVVSNFFLNNQEVGEVNLHGKWNKSKESVVLNGDLYYKKNKTFNFDGDYYIYKDKNNINFVLDFDQTNIQFASAFLDPKVVTNVKGLLDGKMHITGTPESPELEGDIDLLGGNAKIEMFGVNFGFNGRIGIERDMFIINNMPVIDEEGNTGSMNGTVLHNDFGDWNFDLFFNIDEYYDVDQRRLVKVDNFLVLNTQYEEGSVYYGKGYATGNANISGYADNLEVIVNMKTERNTNINFPMFGVTELEDELSFKWENLVKDSIIVLPEIDFTGVDLDLNFNVTPDATLKLIFDEQTGDEITAQGKGQIGIKLNNLNDLSMDGTYTVTQGNYNFVLGVLKKSFNIENGGTISWNGGGAEDATLNLKSNYLVSANVNDIVQDLESKKSSASNQPVFCNLYLTGMLSDPQIRFEIKSPKASESARAAIERINSNSDELNKQFFSLLIANRFQPNVGVSGTGSGSNAALDALSGQINSLLGELSKDVRLNVDLKNDIITGQNSQKIGFSTNALNDKLIITGVFGVEKNAGGSNQSTFIGDLNLEYILDENGNFRVSIFNESNDYTVIQDRNLGRFTQGVGLQYQEDFQTWNDFKLLQTVLDVFRKEKKVTLTRKRKRTPVPPLKQTENISKPDEEN